ncbi:MAG: hypothetical protein PVF22_05345 [Candidatus Aminicenantes bacterium]|jgi:hypothetical protein
MKKLGIFAFVLMFIALSSPALSVESLQTALVPQKAKWFVHFDVAKIAKTQFKQVFIDQHDTDFEREILGIEKTVNIDFFRDITAVTAIGMNNDTDEPVIAFSGDLNKDHLIALLEEAEDPEEIEYSSFIIYCWDGDEYGVFISDRLLLISEDRYGIEKVLDSFSGKEQNISATALSTQLKTASPDTFFIAASEDVSRLVEDEDDIPSLLLQKSETAFFTAGELNRQLKMKLHLQTDSPETAKNLGDMVTGLKAYFAMDEKIDTDWDIIKNLKTSIQERTVVLESTSPSEEFMRILMGKK